MKLPLAVLSTMMVINVGIKGVLALGSLATSVS